MASGTITLTQSGVLQGQIVWSSTNNKSTNTSTVTATLQIRKDPTQSTVPTTGQTWYWALTVGSNSNSHQGSGQEDYQSIGNSWVTQKTLTTTVTHNAAGTATCYIYGKATGPSGTSLGGVSVSGSQTVTLDTTPTYTLSTSAGTGSSITVNRTSSGYSGASTGNLASGARLYYGDKLKITFTPSSGYVINAHTVNGSSFTSGNTHTVSANVSVVSTAVAYYSLSISVGTGSSITVNRTSSPIGGTGNLSNGARIYYGDKLKISFSASSGYVLNAHTVNGSTFTSGGTHTVAKVVSVVSTAVKTYTLSISAGTGSTVTVNRTSSPIGGTGNLSNGATLYHGDTLKISFTASTNYAISTHTVNGVSFTSGNTHTVSAAVSVVATAVVLASSVGATNADIESVSTITVTRYSEDYVHSLSFAFGSLSGYIAADGSISETEVKYTNTSIAFTVPATFYAEIPNAQYGTCVITCRTYQSASSTTILGTETTASFRVTASYLLCSPIVSGTVTDVNSVTAALTGDSSKLIRYRSTAECTISATARNSATIVSKYINQTVPTEDKVTFANVSETTFGFVTNDSRGYQASLDITPTMIDYIELTCNPILERGSSTSNEVFLSGKGDMYIGSFGALSNELTIKFRYREQGGVYSGWEAVSADVDYGSYGYEIIRTSLGAVFDYHTTYDIDIQVTDGNGSYILSTVVKSASIASGVPIFDWGKEDFNFNVPVNIDGALTTSGDISSDSIVSGAELNISGDASISGDATVTGNTTVTGDLTVNGIISVPNDILMNGIGVMGFVKVLTTESLGSIGGQGIYQQPYNANATTARGYPVPYAGYLEVINKSVDGDLFVMQRYTAYRRSYTSVQPEVFTRFYYYVTGWTAWTPKPDTQFTLTSMTNSYVSATDFTRMQAYRRNNINILEGNLQLTNSLPSNATFFTIGTITNWSALTDVTVVAPAQNGSGAILVSISAAGIVQIWNGSGTAATGFHRFSLTVPSASS